MLLAERNVMVVLSGNGKLAPVSAILDRLTELRRVPTLEGGPGITRFWSAICYS